MNPYSRHIASVGAADYFADLAKLLVEGLKNKPGLAGICLIAVIAATVVVALKAERKLRSLFVLLASAMLLIAALTWLEIRRQRDTWQNPIDSIPSDHTAKFTLTVAQKHDIKIVLEKAAIDVADRLTIDRKLVRANLFAPDERERMHIVPDLSYNMHSPDELTIVVPVGYGSTGRCFRSGKPNIAVFQADWGVARLADEELRKVDADLKWIISIPVTGKNDTVRPVCVMNVDCLNETRTETDLRSVVGALYPWSYTISVILSQNEPPISRPLVDPLIKASETTDIQKHSLVTNIQETDITYPTEAFFKSTSDFSSIPPLNTFTKNTFNKQVQLHFKSDKN